MIMIKLNDSIVDRFEAGSTEWTGQFEFVPTELNTLQIEHYGKNYITDSNPDKFFHLEKIWINDVDLKRHIQLLKQTAYLPPWDTEGPPDYSHYLGHNGYLELKFTAPVDLWIKKVFNISTATMDGQESTRKVLSDVKKFFELD
jgi:hypothetical protein